MCAPGFQIGTQECPHVILLGLTLPVLMITRLKRCNVCWAIRLLFQHRACKFAADTSVIYAWCCPDVCLELEK